MATRSTISIQKNDGTIRSVYCHWDGYCEHNGVLLYNFYNTTDKVNELIDYGDISSLGSEIGKKHNFGDLYDGCTFYHRDRNEEKHISVYNKYQDIEEEECNYIFIEEKNEWIVKEEYEAEYEKLENVFKNHPLSSWNIAVSNEAQYEKMVDFYNKFGENVKIPKIEEVLYEV